MLALLKILQTAGGRLPAGGANYKAQVARALVSRGLAAWRIKHHETFTEIHGLDITEAGRERLVEAREEG
jgi:hypothetical protein